MALEGTIKEFGLADIFQLIGLQKKTGILFLKGSDETVNIHFEDGMVVKVDESKKRPRCLVGRIFINRGKITEPQLKEALEIQKSTGQKVGGVLISQGLINKDELRDALSFQINEAVYKVFRWKGGDYKFDQERVDFDRDTITPLSTEHILMDGIRMLDEWPMIENKLPAMHVVLKKRTDAASDYETEGSDIFTGLDEEKEFGVSRDAAHILKLADGKKSLLEILEFSMLGEFDTLKTVVNLIEKGILAESDARPEIISQPEAVPQFKPKKAARDVTFLKWLPYPIILCSILVITLQLTGTRRIMDPHETSLTNLKAPFATMTVRKVRNAISGYYFDLGAYPESLQSLVQLDYISVSDEKDPWGSEISIIKDEDGNYKVVSAGEDRKFGTEDDIASAP
jgi:Domain of unknown function (DUF4388)/Type II secretion system (T2SS), protein G